MTAGRIPRPTKIQVDLRGDPSKRRKNCVEPEAPSGRPACPEQLKQDTIAAQEWESVRDQLQVLGVLSTVDVVLLELYAKTYSRYRHAEAQIDKFGEVLISPNSKTPMVSPYYTARNRYATDISKYLIELGLTPAARARMRIAVEDKKPDSKWANIMKVV